MMAVIKQTYACKITNKAKTYDYKVRKDKRKNERKNQNILKKIRQGSNGRGKQLLFKIWKV